MESMREYQRLKNRLLGALTGTVVEIGAGRGRNFARFRAGIDWIGVEPDAARRRVLAGVAAEHGFHNGILGVPAEDLPLPDGSVDAVVATVVLCSVSQPAAVIAEAQRVLKPGGEFVFFEHVSAPEGSWQAWLQRVWSPVSRRYDLGCDPTRQTWKVLEQAGFAELELRWFTRRFGLVHNPYIAGVGRKG